MRTVCNKLSKGIRLNDNGVFSIMVRKPEIKPSDHYIVGIGASAGARSVRAVLHEHTSGKRHVVHPGAAPRPHAQEHNDGPAPPLHADGCVQAEDGMKVAPDKVYIIPPNKDMSIMHKTLRLMEPTAKRGSGTRWISSSARWPRVRRPYASSFRELVRRARWA